MGRRSHSRSLSVWTNGERVGVWTIPARGDMQLQYDAGWLAPRVRIVVASIDQPRGRR
jgi:serine/threonine-protein kinase HipA